MANEFIVRKGIISMGGVTVPHVKVTSSYNIGDNDYLIECSGSFPVELPNAIGISGKIYVIKNTNIGNITVTTTSSQTIDGSATRTLTEYQSLYIQSNGENWLITGPSGSTGLEAIDEGNGIGWRLIGRTPANYGNIGLNAIDLGASDSPSTTVGSTGQNSTVGGGMSNKASGGRSTVGGGSENEAISSYSTVGGGYQNKASGQYSTVGGGTENEASDFQSTVGGGVFNKASSEYSTVGGGNGNKASGDHSTVGGGEYSEAIGNNSTVGGGLSNVASGAYSAVSGGINNLAKTFGEFLGGLWSTIKEGNASAWIGTDRIFGIGNGKSSAERSDAFNVYKNGVAELPSVTNSLIDAAGAKTIPTKEWVQEQGGIDFTTDESLYLDPITNELRANLTTTIDTFDYLSGVQEFTLTETPVRMLYIWVQGVGLVKKNAQYEVDEVNKKLTILDELEGGEVITACYHNVINESITPFVTDVQVENKDLDDFRNESADPYVRFSEIPSGGGGGGVQSVTGDGVGGTPEDVVMTFPTPSEIGAQDELVSGTNIKTVNNESLLGSGNIDIQGIQGEQGIQGDKGDKGDKGEQGIQGEQGPAGADGVAKERIKTSTAVTGTYAIDLLENYGLYKLALSGDTAITFSGTDDDNYRVIGIEITGDKTFTVPPNVQYYGSVPLSNGIYQFQLTKNTTNWEGKLYKIDEFNNTKKTGYRVASFNANSVSKGTSAASVIAAYSETVINENLITLSGGIGLKIKESGKYIVSVAAQNIIGHTIEDFNDPALIEDAGLKNNDRRVALILCKGPGISESQLTMVASNGITGMGGNLVVRALDLVEDEYLVLALTDLTGVGTEFSFEKVSITIEKIDG